MGTLDLKVNDNEYKLVQKKLDQYVSDLRENVDYYKGCMNYILENQSFVDDTFPGKVEYQIQFLDKIMNALQNVTEEVKTICSDFVDEIDEKDQFIY